MSDKNRELPKDGNGDGCFKTGSDVLEVNEQTLTSNLAEPLVPTIGQINITKPFEDVKIGHRYNTQNVDQSTVDQEPSGPKYVRNLIKNTKERLIWIGAMIILVLCITSILIFTLEKKEVVTELDIAPHPWNVTRDMWLAIKVNETDTTKLFDPLHLVVIHHTVSPDCDKFITCAAEIRTLQQYFIDNIDIDIPYNFMIGNDGRVYEGRGFGLVGAHTYSYNRCSLGIGFIGDYREKNNITMTKVTPLQVENLHRLLDEGVKRGALHPDYHVLGARDLRDTESPGSNLYNAMKSWPHYDHKGLYRHKSCAEIRDMYNTHYIA